MERRLDFFFEKGKQDTLPYPLLSQLSQCLETTFNSLFHRRMSDGTVTIVAPSVNTSVHEMIRRVKFEIQIAESWLDSKRQNLPNIHSYLTTKWLEHCFT